MTTRRATLIGLSAGAVIGFGAGHYHLQHLVRSAFVSAPKGELDPATLEFRRQRLDFFRSSSSTADTVMLGDSLTEWGDWSELLGGERILNRGIRGDRSADVLARVDEVRSHRPRRVFVMVGINDLRTGVTPAQVAGNVARAASALRRAGAQVIVQSVLPVAASMNEPQTNVLVGELNDLLQQLSTREKVHFLDVRPAMTVAGVLNPSFTWDGLHLTAGGYVKWRDAIVADLRAKE